MKKILVIEDERTIARLYAKKLTQTGFEVAVAHDIEEATEVIQNFQADCIFLDHGIKGKDKSGTDFIPIARARFPHVTIIMLSNYASEAIRTGAKTGGVDAFLTKIDYSPRILAEYTLNLFDLKPNS